MQNKEIISKDFIQWCENANQDMQKNMYKFVIYVLCDLSIKYKIKLIYVLIRGKEFYKKKLM